MYTEPTVLLCNSAHGQFIPQLMAQELVDAGWDSILPEDVEICKAGPEHEGYWEAWTSVLDNAVFIDPATKDTYMLYQDGDLWAYNVSMLLWGAAISVFKDLFGE